MGPIEYRFLSEALEERRKNHRLRCLKNIVPLDGPEVALGGRKMINFSSNDYLGLSFHPLLRQRAVEYIERYGSGSTASRLVCGNYECFEKVERKLAELTGHEGALVFNSGFQANVSLLPALANRDTLILSDSLNHNSIIQGCKLSRSRVETFRHNDMDHLEDLLRSESRNASRKIIVTESVFSMDGDVCDMDGLLSLSERYGAFLFVDEAHAVGVMGKNGMGIGNGRNVDLAMGTFSKGAGAFGAFAASRDVVKDYLVNFCNGLIYTTALPPAVIGAIDAALDLIPEMEQARKRLAAMSKRLRHGLKELGYDTGKSTTHIVPVIMGGDKETLHLSRWLEENNVLAVTFRPPTVPAEGSRIRLTLTALHDEDHVQLLIDLFRRGPGS